MKQCSLGYVLFPLEALERWQSMRFVVTPILALLFVMVAFSSGAAHSEAEDAGTDWAELALPPETFSDIVPQAPGPYTGPSDAAIPAGWNAWTDDVHQQCGDLKLVFLNPDLQEDDNGIIHASNRFFIQFQAVGENADQITRFSFSFGKTHEAINNNPALNCDENLPDSQLGKGTGGAYLLFYRSDFNKDDGFFVPIETMNVPDGDYGAAVHAYTGNDLTGYVEVARAWAMATVKNCDGVSVPNSCAQGGPEEQQKNDKTMPWPMVLPGDGEQTNDVTGLTVEVMESLGSGSTPEEMSQSAITDGRIKAWLNGDELTLTPWTPPARDRDVIPLNDEDGCPGGQNVRSVCEKVVYSTGAKWEGEVKCDDIIKVETTDLNGNTATKQIHNCRTFGGASTADYPILDYKVVGSDKASIEAGKEGGFKMRIENVGGGDAHVNLLLDYNKTNMVARWQNVEAEHEHPGGAGGETHVQIDPGTATELEIVVNVKGDAPKGSFPLAAGLEYPAAGETQMVWRNLTVDILSAVVEENTTANLTEDEPKVEDSPAVAPLLVAAGALGAVAVLRRRRD